MTNSLETCVSEVGAGGDVEGGELGAVGGEAGDGLVWQLVAGGEVQGLDVVTVEGEADESGVSNILTTIETETLEEAPAAPGEVLHHHSLDIHLKLKQINSLPVWTIQSKNIPRLTHLQHNIVNMK